MNSDLALKSIMILLVLGAAALANGELHTQRPEVAIRSQADVAEKKIIRVMDIATVDYAEPALAQKVLALPVVEAGAEGKAMTFKNVDLIHIIRSKILENQDLALQKWTYFVPEEVQFHPKKILMSPLSAENQIHQALLAKCGDCTINIKDLRIPNSTELSALQNCQLQTETLKVGGTFLLPVQCDVGRETRTYWVSGIARVSKMAPISSRQISPGDRMTLRDFHMGEVDLTYAQDGVPSETDLVGQVAARLIAVNQPIFRRDLKKEAAIQRGQVVRAIMGDDSFEVSSQGVAEDNGFVGDTVRIKNSETQKILSGVVIEKGVVKIQ